MSMADPEDTWDPSRRTFDTRAIHQALAQSAHTIEQVYIAFGYEREGDEARRIFQLPAKEGCGVERCISRNGRKTLAFPRLKQLFLRTSDLSASFFPSLLLGSPKMQSLWITHSPTSHSSHFEVPLAALPDLVELNINLPFAPSSWDHSGLQNLVKNKSKLRDLVLSEDVPLEVMFVGEEGKDIETFTTWGGVSKSLLKVVNDKLVGLRELSFEGSSWSDEDLSIVRCSTLGARLAPSLTEVSLPPSARNPFPHFKPQESANDRDAVPLPSVRRRRTDLPHLPTRSPPVAFPTRPMARSGRSLALQDPPPKHDPGHQSLR